MGVTWILKTEYGFCLPSVNKSSIDWFLFFLKHLNILFLSISETRCVHTIAVV